MDFFFFCGGSVKVSYCIKWYWRNKLLYLIISDDDDLTCQPLNKNVVLLNVGLLCYVSTAATLQQ